MSKGTSSNGIRGPFMVRFEDGDPKKGNLQKSLTSGNARILRVIKPNHLSNMFAKLESEALERKGANSASTLASGKSKDTSMNLFGSRLDDAAVNRKKIVLSSKVALDPDAEFKDEAAFVQIKAIVDQLEAKGMLTEDGKLTSKALIDDNCARDNPRLSALIDWAAKINCQWVLKYSCFIYEKPKN